MQYLHRVAVSFHFTGWRVSLLETMALSVVWCLISEAVRRSSYAELGTVLAHLSAMHYHGMSRAHSTRSSLPSSNWQWICMRWNGVKNVICIHLHVHYHQPIRADRFPGIKPKVWHHQLAVQYTTVLEMCQAYKLVWHQWECPALAGRKKGRKNKALVYNELQIYLIFLINRNRLILKRSSFFALMRETFLYIKYVVFFSAALNSPKEQALMYYCFL